MFLLIPPWVYIFIRKSRFQRFLKEKFFYNFRAKKFQSPRGSTFQAEKSFFRGFSQIFSDRFKVWNICALLQCTFWTCHRVAAFARSPTAESMESYADRNSSADSGDIPPAAVSTLMTVSSRSPASDTLYIMSYT